MHDTIDIRRADERFHTRTDWLDSWHSFSFGPHYDPANTHHGQLLVVNDDVIAGGAGFGMHPHRDMEIVTWVLEGRLEHRDSAGNHGVIYPGLAQRMSAGSGIRHSEVNADPHADVRLLQMWVVPDTAGLEPSYEQKDVRDLLADGRLVPVASGSGHPGAIHLHQRDAVMWVGRLAGGTTVGVPGGGHVHLIVARGSGAVGDETLGQGDAARLVALEDGELEFTAADDTEIVVWTTA